MGRLTADPETRYTPSNISIARFTLAVNRGGKPQEGQPTADFLNIVTWRTTADFVGKYFKKGMQVLVEGRIHNNNYTDKEGQKRFNVEITADQVYFADSRKDGSGDNSGGGYNRDYSNSGGNSGGSGSGYGGGNYNNAGNSGGNQGNSGSQSNSGGYAANNTATPEAGDGFYTLNEDDEDLPF